MPFMQEREGERGGDYIDLINKLIVLFVEAR